VKYEREKFKEYLEYYKDGFPLTEQWLKRNMPQAAAEEETVPSASSSSATASVISPDKKVKDIIFNSYMELLSWDPAHEFPEFFSMDIDRLRSLRGRALRICACASSLAIVTGLPVIAQAADVKKSLAKEIEILLQNVNTEKELEDALQNVWLQIKSVLSKRLQELNQKPLDEEAENSLKQHIMKISSIDESPVRKLMWKRLFTYVQLVLRSNVNIPAPPGFQDFVDELDGLGQAFRRVTYYNYAVYNEFYNDIVNKLSNS
jgi:hypothetical protein